MEEKCSSPSTKDPFIRNLSLGNKDIIDENLYYVNNDVCEQKRRKQKKTSGEFGPAPL